MKYEDIEEGKIYKLDNLYYKAIREQKVWQAWLFEQLNNNFRSWATYGSSTYKDMEIKDMEIAEESAQILYGTSN